MMSINSNTDLFNDVIKERKNENLELSFSTNDQVSLDATKIASYVVPDSPPTIFTTANSSPNQNLTNEKGASSNLSQLYSLFSRTNDDMKNKELQNLYYPLASSVISQNNNQLLPPSLINNNCRSAPNGNSTNNNDLNSNDSNNINTKIINNALIGGICVGGNYRKEASETNGTNTNNGIFDLNDSSVPNNYIDFYNFYNQYLNSQIDWTNYSNSTSLNLYYQQLALYNQMIMSMYLPMFVSGGCNKGVNNNLNQYMSQLLSSSTPLSNQSVSTTPSTYSKSCVNTGPYSLYSDTLTNKLPKMISLANLSQLYTNTNSSNIGNNVTGGIVGGYNGFDIYGNVIYGSLPTSNSPINSSSYSLASIISPINKPQKNASKSSESNNPDANYDFSTPVVWGSTQNGIFESPSNQNSVPNYSKLSSNVKNVGKKGEKTRKYTRNNCTNNTNAGNNNSHTNVGARRKIDKNSAICIVCGTTQTSQWRFLNLGELFLSNCNKDDNSCLKFEENHQGEECSSGEHSTNISVNTGTANNNSSAAIIDKQICCNACYMKYDKNRPRYRNGKKVPPPLPTYLYTHVHIPNKINENNVTGCKTDDNAHLKEPSKHELVPDKVIHTN